MRDIRHEPGGETPSDTSRDRNVSMSYGRFGAMIATSGVAMFSLMYLNSYELSHVTWSETRFYMSFVMVAVMAVIMLAFMFSMYADRRKNIGIIAGSVLVFAGALWLVRSQATIQDESWMSAMIPHHSIAILTSERAGIEDQRVCELAVGIIEAQNREIAEMNWLIDDIDQNGVAATPAEAETRPFQHSTARVCARAEGEDRAETTSQRAAANSATRAAPPVVTGSPWPK